MRKINAETTPKIISLYSEKELIKADIPTIGEIKNKISIKIASGWLLPFITDVVQLSNTANVNTTNNINIANGICTEYNHLKLTEIMLFFHKFKMGKYGKFYGSVDILTITTALNQFDKEIREKRIVIQREKQTEIEERTRIEQNKPYDKVNLLKCRVCGEPALFNRVDPYNTYFAYCHKCDIRVGYRIPLPSKEIETKWNELMTK